MEEGKDSESSPKRIKLSDPPASSPPSSPQLTPFSLLRVRGLAGPFNTGHLGVHLRDLISGPLQFAFVSNYMIDLPWLLSACPNLKNAAQTVIVHGERDQRAAALRAAAKDAGLKGVTVHAPPLPIQFGTHHSKAFILGYQAGVRVVIHTANLIYADCNNKTQGVYWQDFPPKSEASASPSSFESTLLDYISALKLPFRTLEPLRQLVKAHDFSCARVWLVPSVPGYHRGRDVSKYGHLRVREGLKREQFPVEFRSAPIVCQFSSIGSIDEKWLLDEFCGSLAAGTCKEGDGGEGERELGPPEREPDGLQLVWPTVSEVRESLEGFGAGHSIPGNSKNVGKPFLWKHWRRYGGERVGRQRAMPHIKTYGRYRGSLLAWVMLASHNLSKAAWGCSQKQGSQVMIRSYELGVLFLPSLEKAFRNSPLKNFSCTSTPNVVRPPLPTSTGTSTDGTTPGQGADDRQNRRGAVPFTPTSGVVQSVRFRCWTRSESVGESDHVVRDAVKMVEFPLPYSLPADAYSGDDQPWMVDVPQPGLDALGRPWGAPVSFYGHKE